MRGIKSLLTEIAFSNIGLCFVVLVLIGQLFIDGWAGLVTLIAKVALTFSMLYVFVEVMNTMASARDRG